MMQAWFDVLKTQGARCDKHGVIDFGDPAAELEAARTGLVLADLSQWGLIAFAGEDAEAFLHGQVTNDLRQLGQDKAVFAGYCSAKGRLLANFLVLRREADILLLLPESLRETIRKRLSLFILRAKVKARDANDEWVRLGLAGAGAEALLAETLGMAAPAAILTVAHTGEAFAVRLGEQRYDLFIRPAVAAAVWQQLAKRARPVGGAAWDWLMVAAGVAAIVPETQDQFVPQMVNMDLLHGISFQKGCYPGQEIVARTQYLGNQKRRLYLAHVDSPARPGAALYSPELAGQSVGMVANAAVSPEGGTDLLAVLMSGSREGNAVHLGTPDGPRLDFRQLPYDV